MTDTPESVNLSDVSSRKVDTELLNELRDLFARAEDQKERYDFTWNGKAKAYFEAATPTTKTLRPQPEESYIYADDEYKQKVNTFNDSENLFITGDNLEALKLLQESYLGKIDMIYIDPPYNTGKDFVYHDNFKSTQKDTDVAEGSVDEDGNRLVKNEKNSGRYHSDWLSMMYPRLKLARNLLSDSGVIFVSIDDNEQANLKLLMDEVFGEDNFVSSIIHQRAKGGGMAKNFVKAHDYIHVFAKNIDQIDIKQRKIVQTKTVNISGKEYLINNDLFRRGFGRKERSAEHRDYFYEELIELDKYRDDVENGLKSGKYFLQQYKNGKHLVARYEPVDSSFSKVYTIQKFLSEEGKIRVDDLMGEGIFDYSKPVNLIKFLIEISTIEQKSAIILDFFAGSGTTADAVMQLNKEDGGNRKFIIATLDESTPEDSEARKAEYQTIDQISRERIRRAAKKSL